MFCTLKWERVYKKWMSWAGKSHSGSFICKDTRLSVQHFHKCSTLLLVNYLQIAQQSQPIHITHNISLHEHTISPYIIHKHTFACPSYPCYLSYLAFSNKIWPRQNSHWYKSHKRQHCWYASKIDDTSVKTDKQEEKLVYISSKLSTYEYRIDKVNINKILQPLPLQVNNEQDEKIKELSLKLSTCEYRLEKPSITETQIQPKSLRITEISPKFSAYENRLDKMSINNIYKFETSMK